METNNTAEILNSTKWQVLRTSNDSANTLATELAGIYSKVSTKAGLDIENSMLNILNNKKATIGQVCEWVELNNGHRIKNKKDFSFIVNHIITTV